MGEEKRALAVEVARIGVLKGLLLWVLSSERGIGAWCRTPSRRSSRSRFCCDNSSSSSAALWGAATEVR